VRTDRKNGEANLKHKVLDEDIGGGNPDEAVKEILHCTSRSQGEDTENYTTQGKDAYRGKEKYLEKRKES